VKKPKDTDKYIDPRLAAMQLISLAMEKILCAKDGIEVRWATTISYRYTDSFDQTGKKVLPMSGSFSSAGKSELQP
jgi:hypothetical protein